MKSIMDTKKGTCFICGKQGPTEEHHLYAGPNRQLSEQYGLKVHLCHSCHNEPPYGVHHNRNTELWLKRKGQEVAMKHYRWTVEDFIEIFGRNYL